MLYSKYFVGESLHTAVWERAVEAVCLLLKFDQLLTCCGRVKNTQAYLQKLVQANNVIPLLLVSVYSYKSHEAQWFLFKSNVKTVVWPEEAHKHVWLTSHFNKTYSFTLP